MITKNFGKSPTKYLRSVFGGTLSKRCTLCAKNMMITMMHIKKKIYSQAYISIIAATVFWCFIRRKPASRDT